MGDNDTAYYMNLYNDSISARVLLINSIKDALLDLDSDSGQSELEECITAIAELVDAPNPFREDLSELLDDVSNVCNKLEELISWANDVFNTFDNLYSDVEGYQSNKEDHDADYLRYRYDDNITEHSTIVEFVRDNV